MAGQPPVNGASESVWRSYVDARFNAIDQRITDALKGGDRYIDAMFKEQQAKVDAAYTASNQRLEAMNEFRNSLEDERKRGIARTEVESHVRTLEDKLLAEAKARAEVADMLAKMDASLSARINQLASDSSRSIERVATDLSNVQAAKKGMAEGWGYLIGAIGLVGAAIGIILAVTQSSGN